MLKRFYDLNNYVRMGKVLLLYGARQVGKTTLLNKYLASCGKKYKLDSGDNIRIQQVLASQDFDQIKQYAQGYDLIAIDEAQQIPFIGRALKIIVDNIPGVIVIATGSSSFRLAREVGEPLTGRKRTIVLYPLSQIELKEYHNKFELKEHLEEYLIYGLYPEVLTSESRVEKRVILDDLVNSYLLKDVLALERVKSSKVLLDLLKLLSFQIGNLVSLNELATQLRIDIKTVARYIDLLENAFVIVSVSGYSRNLRKEITSKNKYYFLDVGIRNAVISQFNEISNRNDIGQLWENFIVVERLKKRIYQNIQGSSYFWRTYSGHEIDIVEEGSGKISAFECKWQDKKIRVPKEWSEKYPDASLEVISQDNYLDFIT